MIKMIIVDDEEMIRQGIRMTGDWEARGIEVVGLAGNGEEALSMIEELRPDIVLSDVVMPYMTGLELCKEVAEHYPDVRMILLSGYDEFEYVKTALEYKAFNYLLKPARIEAIVEKVLQLKEEIERDRARRLNEDDMRRKLEESLPVWREQMLNRLIDGTLTPDLPLADWFRELGIALHEERLILMVLRVGGPKEGGAAETNALYRQLLCREACVRAFPEKESFHLFEDRTGCLVILFNGTPECSNSAMLRDALERGADILACLDKYAGYGGSIGIGRLPVLPRKLHLAYKEAAEALEHEFYMGSGNVIYIGDVEKGADTDVRYPEELDQEILRCIRIGNYNGASEAVEAFFCGILGDVGSKHQPDRLMDPVLHLLGSLSRIFAGRDTTFGPKADPELSAKHLLSAVVNKNISTLPELRAFVLMTVKKMTDLINADKMHHHVNIIENAKAFIVDNCHKDVSLQHVAEAVHISPNYLSWLFKEESGMNFKDYVTRVRMEKSLELLASSKQTLSQIADAVGYSDGRYFSKVFRKVFGKSPEEFRNEHA